MLFILKLKKIKIISKKSLFLQNMLLVISQVFNKNYEKTNSFTE